MIRIGVPSREQLAQEMANEASKLRAGVGLSQQEMAQRIDEWAGIIFLHYEKTS
jgi:ribosome-binding protein aMBF1 (putative translation factor)